MITNVNFLLNCSRRKKMGSEAWELERRYSVPGALDTRGLEPPASEDLHAWSIYR